MLSDWWFFPRLARHLEADVLPAAGEALARWHARASAIPDPGLRARALSSLTHKRFHAEGGAVLAAFAPRRDDLIEALVALQTIADYLDTLADRPHRGDVTPPSAARRLHRAMVDAVRPERPAGGDYYPGWRSAGAGTPAAERPGEAPTFSRPPAGGAFASDGGYLNALVGAARLAVGRLPGHPAVAGPVERLARQYGEMQALKHGPVPSRTHALAAWHARWGHGRHQGWTWWEGAASAGSTLGMFACLRLAAAGRAPEAALVRKVLDTYVPWVTGLHILLDYLVDRREDSLSGDLNFTRPYGPPEAAAARLEAIYRQALRRASRLPEAGLHRAVLVGLVALYGSDGKVGHPAAADLRRAVDRLVRSTGLIGRAARSRVQRQRRGGAWRSEGPNGPA